jgi:hypothetical protein
VEETCAMPNSKILYYPHYQPTSKWLRSMLLLTDQIERIVPSDADPEDDDLIKELMQSLPGSLTSRPPEQHDIDFDHLTLERLRFGFRFIKKNIDTTVTRGVKIVITPTGSISIEGHTFLHCAKIAPQVREMLKEEGLLLPFLKNYAGIIGAENYLPVPSEASNLILTCIADRIARREGLDTATDEDLPFATSTLNSLHVSIGAPAGAAEGALLSAVIRIIMPEEVANLNMKAYSELRESYMPIREAFKSYTAEISAINRLYRIEDPNFFSHRIALVAEQIEKECSTYKKSVFSRRFKSWAPFSAGSILSIGAAIVDPAFGLNFAAGSVAIGLISKVFIEGRLSSETPVACRLLADLRSDILKKATVNALV